MRPVVGVTTPLTDHEASVDAAVAAAQRRYRKALDQLGREGACVCGSLATANDRECPACFRERLRSATSGFTPTRTKKR